MASIDDVLDKLSADVTARLAPYQPDLPPLYPNPAATAGGISATYIAPGHPIQVDVMSRLENKQSQVGVYDTQPERIYPFQNRERVAFVDGNGNIYHETGGADKKVVVEIWSWDRTSRGKISSILRSAYGDAFRLIMDDTTTTLFRYIDTVPFDMEQKDSVYIYQMHWMANFTTLTLSEQGAAATTVETGFTPNGQAPIILPARSLG